MVHRSVYRVNINVCTTLTAVSLAHPVQAGCARCGGGGGAGRRAPAAGGWGRGAGGPTTLHIHAPRPAHYELFRHIIKLSDVFENLQKLRRT